MTTRNYDSDIEDANTFSKAYKDSKKSPFWAVLKNKKTHKTSKCIKYIIDKDAQYSCCDIKTARRLNLEVMTYCVPRVAKLYKRGSKMHAA
uniref:Uncharacterized protein n=1 Tax=Ditylenchus dipsaci TaxID=166011 RepID=A0A915DQ39_9BILA